MLPKPTRTNRPGKATSFLANIANECCENAEPVRLHHNVVKARSHTGMLILSRRQVSSNHLAGGDQRDDYNDLRISYFAATLTEFTGYA